MNATRAGGSAGTDELPHVAWRISSRSPNGSGNCVEAGPLEDGSGRVAVRHSHHPRGTSFVYSRTGWATFIGRIKRGDFDDPA